MNNIMKNLKLFKIILIGYLCIYIYPFFVSMYYSFTNSLSSGRFAGIKNYIDLLRSEAFRLAAFNTIKYALIAIPVLMGISLLLALAFNFFLTSFESKIADRLLGIDLFSMAIPVASIYLLICTLFGDYGVINDIFKKNILWFNSDYSFWIVLLIYIWNNCSYCTVIFLVGLNRIDKSIIEAAKIDGAGSVSIFFNIMAIEILPNLIFNIVISITGIFKMYRVSHMLFGDYPHESVYMIQNFLNNNFNNGNFSRLTAASITILLVLFIPIYLMLSFYKKR